MPTPTAAYAIHCHDHLSGDLAGAAWKLYERSFRGLAELAVQRHLMYPAEFDAVMADRRVSKYVALDGDGNPAGLATFTNQIDAMPLISPDYFARRWPELYAAGQVWIVGFVCADPAVRGVFAELVGHMWARAGGGLIVIDMCRHNVEARHLDRAIDTVVHGIAGAGHCGQLLDSQHFYRFETGVAA